MIKRLALIFFVPIFLVTGGFVAFLSFSKSSLVPSNPNCGLFVSQDLMRVLPEDVLSSNWTVYSYPGTAVVPHVAIGEHPSWKSEVIPVNTSGCRLTFKNITDTEARGVDWRIGRRFPVEYFKGRTIKTTFFLRAKKPANLPEGTIYSYNGKTVAEIGVKHIPDQWQQHEVIQRVAEEDNVFEIWFRLVFDKPEATPASNSIDLIASIEEVDESYTSTSVSAFNEGLDSRQAAKCHTEFTSSQSLTNDDHKNNDWKIYSYNGKKPSPTVLVEENDNGCTLNITDAPTSSRATIDWRIGKDLGVENIRGKTVTFTADLSSVPNSNFTSGSLYLYDGKNVNVTAFERITGEDKRFSVAADFPTNATAAEAWLRLVLMDGTISPATIKMKFVPTLNIE